MADHLFLRMLAKDNDVEIVRLDADGQLLARPERLELQAAAAGSGDSEVTVLLPAESIVSCVARIPAASPARLRQMLPFTLEDEFAGDIDDLHFAAGERNAENLLAVSACTRSALDETLAILRAAGVESRRIFSEADGLPDTPGLVTLFAEGDRIMGRRPDGAPFAFTGFSFRDLWNLLANEREDGDDLRRVVLFTDPATRSSRQAEIDEWRTTLDDLDIKELADGCLYRLAANLVHRPGVNLLQGSYATRSDISAMVRPWRTAAGFLIALVGLTLAGKLALVWRLSADASQLQEDIIAVCQTSYGNSNVDTCRREMLRRLDAAGQTASGNGPGFLMAQATIAAAGGDAMQMETISYRDGVLSVVFVAPNVPFVETFSQAVNQTGLFQVRDQSTTAEANGVRARMNIVEQNR